MRCKKILFSIIIFPCLISSCTHKSAGNVITIKAPFVISHNIVTLEDESAVFINIEMIKGQYTFNPGPSPLQGNNWVGDYQVRVYTDEFDLTSVLYTSPISVYEGDKSADQSMDFSQPFSLVFDDYNGDGSPDFTLGQYGASNWNDYAIFTISPKGNVSLLDTGGTLAVGQWDYSIQLDKLTSNSFQTEMWANTAGKTVYTTYTWSGNSFIKKQQA